MRLLIVQYATGGFFGECSGCLHPALTTASCTTIYYMFLLSPFVELPPANSIFASQLQNKSPKLANLHFFLSQLSFFCKFTSRFPLQKGERLGP
jgi:hypothetical protein